MPRETSAAIGELSSAMRSGKSQIAWPEAGPAYQPMAIDSSNGTQASATP